MKKLQKESMDHGEMAQRYYPQDDSEMTRGTQFHGDLAVTTQPLESQVFDDREQTWAERKMGHWQLEGTWNGKPIFIDSRERYGGEPTDIESWEDPRKARYAMARLLLSHFGRNDPSFNMKKHYLDQVRITVNGQEV